MNRTADVVICGAGIAGVCAAWWLTVREGIRNVVLVDEREPLSLTSDKSSEAYRNWWPGPDASMIAFMNRNIDLLEEFAHASDNRFLMNRRGYLYCTTRPERAAQYLVDAERAAEQGAGDVRVYRTAAEAQSYRRSTHTGFVDHPAGADIFLDAEAIRAHFPGLAPDVVGVLHARRCGWLSGQQLGAHLLEEARAAGARVVTGRLAAVDTTGNRVRSVRIDAIDGTSTQIDTPVFVNAAGPFAKQVGALLGVDLPIFSELHLKAAFEDDAGVCDRDAGLVIFDDPQLLDWTDEERDELAAHDDTRWLTQPMPPGVHYRPEGYRQSRTVLMLWDYHTHRYDVPEFPLPDDPPYPELVMRGLARLIPGLQRYVDRLPRSFVDGGYYTKTAENRPLIGPLPVDGAYIDAAFSGFGLMAAPAAGELLGAHITGAALPEHAKAFVLARYDDPSYREQLAHWGSTGQL